MASLDFDQKFLGRIAKQTSAANPLLSSSLYQILGLSVILARRLVKARKLRKLDTTRDTPSLAAYQHILWLSREGLSILEYYVLPFAQDNQHGPECRVLSVKLRASFYHIFCLFHNQPPITATNMASTDPRTNLAPPVPHLPHQGGSKNQPDAGSGQSPSSKRAGKQPMLREPIDSITSETSFLTNPYAAGGPVGTPSPGPRGAPPGLNPIPIPQPSSFILPHLNYVPLASGYFTTATAYAQQFLPGSHPLRLSVAIEHAAFLWDCLHDHEGSRRMARRAIKDVYRAQEGMDDAEFDDAAELVGILGRMMKRKSWEGTPRVPGTSVASPVSAGAGEEQVNGAPVGPAPQSPQTTRRAAEGSPMTVTTPQRHASTKSKSGRSRSGSTATQPRQTVGGSQGNTPRVGGGGSKESTPRARHLSSESGGSTTPRAPQGSQAGRSPATPSTVRTVQPISPSATATMASEAIRASPTLRRTPPLSGQPPSQDVYHRSQRFH